MNILTETKYNWTGCNAKNDAKLIGNQQKNIHLYRGNCYQ